MAHKRMAYSMVVHNIVIYNISMNNAVVTVTVVTVTVVTVTLVYSSMIIHVIPTFLHAPTFLTTLGLRLPHTPRNPTRHVTKIHLETTHVLTPTTAKVKVTGGTPYAPSAELKAVRGNP